MDHFEKHICPVTSSFFGTDQDELVRSGWPKKVIDLHHIFCTKPQKHFCTKHFFFNWKKKTHDLHLLFHYKWKLEEYVSPRIHAGLRLLLRIYLQQHKHGHLPYVPAEIFISLFITDASGFHLTEWRFYNISKAGIYTRHQQCPKMRCFFYKWHISGT